MNLPHRPAIGGHCPRTEQSPCESTWQELEEKWAQAMKGYLRGGTIHPAFSEEDARALIQLRKEMGYAYKASLGNGAN